MERAVSQGICESWQPQGSGVADANPRVRDRRQRRPAGSSGRVWSGRAGRFAPRCLVPHPGDACSGRTLSHVQARPCWWRTTSRCGRADFGDPGDTYVTALPKSGPRRPVAPKVLYSITTDFRGVRFARLDANQQVLQDQELAFVTPLARNGNPNAAGTPSWPKLNNSGDVISVQPAGDSELVSTSEMAAQRNCSSWDRVAQARVVEAELARGRPRANVLDRASDSRSASGRILPKGRATVGWIDHGRRVLIFSA